MKRIALPLLITGTLAIAACGSDDPTTGGGGGGGSSANAPTPAEMLTKAITETTNQKSAAFQITANVSGATDDPDVKPFLEKPIKVDISGKGGPKAVDISGKANVRGQDYQLGRQGGRAAELHPVHEHVVRARTRASPAPRRAPGPTRPSSSRRC